jgi:hypothetical protein
LDTDSYGSVALPVDQQVADFRQSRLVRFTHRVHGGRAGRFGCYCHGRHASRDRAGSPTFAQWGAEWLRRSRTNLLAGSTQGERARLFTGKLRRCQTQVKVGGSRRTAVLRRCCGKGSCFGQSDQGGTAGRGGANRRSCAWRASTGHGADPAMPAPVPPAEPRASTVENSVLLARGDSLFGVGDVASAQLFYARAADARDSQAALRLGKTHDPFFIVRARLNGVRGDFAVTTRRYRRARDLGARKAENR